MMGWGKAWEKQEQEAKAANVELMRKATEERELEAHKQSPVGQAEAAYANGEAFYQLEMEVSALAGPHSSFGSSENTTEHFSSPGSTLGQIEAIGWKLEHVGYVFVETGSTSTERFLVSGQGVVTKGHIAGIYLFRRR